MNPAPSDPHDIEPAPSDAMAALPAPESVPELPPEQMIESGGTKEQATASSFVSPPPSQKSWGRLVARVIGLLLLLCLCVGGWIGWEGWQFLHTSPEAPGRSVIVNIKTGATLAQASDSLHEAGVITDSLRFQILARVKKQETRVQAGRFLFNTGWLPEKVLEELVSGKAMLYRVTLREGLPWWEVARVLEREGICKAADFKDVIHDPEFLRHWGIPFTSAEGFLYPDTYFMLRPVNAKDMTVEWNDDIPKDAARAAANRLVDMFWRKTSPLWQESGNERPDTETLRRTLTLASIIEKETGVPAERARVAGVYANRLSKNMLLQADPTIIYGLGPEFSGQLLRKHLDDPSNTYNTYQKPGLPPGPICSPGAASINAALNPESHAYLYFVATGKSDGGHTFSETLNDHNRAVRQYRETIRKQGQ